MPALEVVGLRKQFPGVVALDAVSLSLETGEVHGLVGQNGAGKSTLINILSGMYARDEGSILLDGKEVGALSTRHARELGIATVYQEQSLLPNLSIAGNFSLGNEPGRFGFLDRTAARRSARAALTRLGLELAPDAQVSSLSFAERQMVEIAKALSSDPKILILDEPTAPLGARECQLLFAAIKRIKSQGVAILYVSHRFAEVLGICDVATVLRNGRHVITTQLEGWTEERLTDAMIGQRTERFRRADRSPGAVALELERITYRQKLNGIDLVARHGEVVGIIGLLGAGQHELSRFIGGDLAADTGRMIVNGREVRLGTPADAVSAGLCLLTEERNQEGILPNRPLRENISVASLPARASPLGIVRRREEASAASEAARRFGVVAASQDMPMRMLSGGNQQKALVARWGLADMDTFVLVEPTRGVDVGARNEIYRRLDELARSGKALIVISSDPAEILLLADRILVIRDGRIAAEADPASLDEDRLNLLVQGAPFV
jgi:ABC-type sugar transport system ATPase subunit